MNSEIRQPLFLRITYFIRRPFARDRDSSMLLILCQL